MPAPPSRQNQAVIARDTYTRWFPRFLATVLFGGREFEWPVSPAQLTFRNAYQRLLQPAPQSVQPRPLARAPSASAGFPGSIAEKTSRLIQGLRRFRRQTATPATPGIGMG